MFSQAAFPFGWHWAAAFSTAHRRDLLELLQKARTRGGIYSERGEIFEVMHDSVHSTAISLFMSTLTKYFDHPCMCPPPHLLEPFYPCFVSLSPFPSSSSFTALFFATISLLLGNLTWLLTVVPLPPLFVSPVLLVWTLGTLALCALPSKEEEDFVKDGAAREGSTVSQVSCRTQGRLQRGCILLC